VVLSTSYQSDDFGKLAQVSGVMQASRISSEHKNITS
jgi:hypothetical protein